jgi:hypothetical protein
MNTMTSKVILSKCLCQHVSDLISSSYWKDLDKAFTHMFTEVMVTDIDVLGTWAKFWEPGKFKGT